MHISKIGRKVGILAGMALATGAQAAVIFSTPLSGDPRVANPDGIVASLTVSDDATNPSLTHWTVDLNSPLHPSANIGTFGFNLVGSPADYRISAVAPTGYTVSTNGQLPGSGGMQYEFILTGPDSPSSANNNRDLTFDVMRLAGPFSATFITNAELSSSNDATLGSAARGAHVRALGPNGSLSGVALSTGGGGGGGGSGAGGGGGAGQVPLPGTVALLGAGLVALGLRTRRR